jgi:S1-C subfamily serine protease
MKEKISHFFSTLQKYLKLMLIVLVVVVLLSLFGLIYLFRGVFIDNNYISNLFHTGQTVPENTLETTNTKIVSEESVVIDVVDRVGSSIVSISYLEDVFAEEGEPIGSGVVVTADGLIVTNKHVIEDEEGSYEVILQDGSRHKVIEIIRDKSKDLALIKINTSNLKPVNFGDTKNIKLGQKAIAVGNAMGFSNTVSVGIVSGLSREVEVDGEMFKNLIQTDAAINPGNSGGALLNSSGDLVGVNTAKSSYAENIGFAIPVDSVKDLVQKYELGEIDKNSVPAFLGVGFVFRDLKEYLNKGLPIGPVITGVLKDSPADKAGLKVGDIVVSIDGIEFSDEYELSEFIKEKNPGDKIKIKVYRKNNTIETEANLVEYIN